MWLDERGIKQGAEVGTVVARERCVSAAALYQWRSAASRPRPFRLGAPRRLR